MCQFLANIDWITLVIGAILGAIPSWLITHIYYQRGSKEQVKLFDKLSAEVREAIINTPGETLKTEDLLKLLEEIRKEPVDASRLVGSIDAGTF